MESRSERKRSFWEKESNSVFQMQWIDEENDDGELPIEFSNPKVISDLAKCSFRGVVEGNSIPVSSGEMGKRIGSSRHSQQF